MVGLAVVARQVQAHHRPVADFGIDPDLATGLLGEAVDHRQAESGALSDRLGGEERVEGAGDHLRRHAGAAVADAQRDVLPGRQLALARRPLVEPAVAGLDGQPAAGRHRVARIDAQVEQRVLELARVDEGAPQPAGRDHLQRDPRTDGAPDQLLEAGDEAVRVGRSRRQRLAAREREQPVGQRRRPPRRTLRGADVAVDLAGAPLRQPRLHHLQGAGDAGQQVVEVVRDAAGELAHRLHLLRLPQLLLRLEAVSGVDRLGDDGDDGAGRVEQRPDRDVV